MSSRPGPHEPQELANREAELELARALAQSFRERIFGLAAKVGVDCRVANGDLRVLAVHFVTKLRSLGQLDQRFLCWLIREMPRREAEWRALFEVLDPKPPEPMPSSGTTFVSYRQSDSRWFVRALFAQMQFMWSSELFIDAMSIRLAENFAQRIKSELSRCHRLLLVIGQRWHRPRKWWLKPLDQEDWVRIELELAMEAGIPIVPVFIDGASMPSHRRFPPHLRDVPNRQGLRVVYPDLEPLVQRLAFTTPTQAH